MKMEAKYLKLFQVHIHGYNGVATEAVGYVELPVELSNDDCTIQRMLPFVVMDIESPNTIFMGLPA